MGLLEEKSHRRFLCCSCVLLEEEMFVDFVRGEEGQCITCLPRSSADHTAELLGRECALLSDPNGWPAHSQQIGFFQAGVNDNGCLMRARGADDAQGETAHLVDHRAHLVACL